MLSLFLAASFLLAIAPGPDNLFVFTHSLTHGIKSGISITLGLCTGLVGHTSLIALGLGELVGENAFVWRVIASVGALYLLYLAYLSWPVENHSSTLGSSANTLEYSLKSTSESQSSHLGSSLAHYYRRGIILNITNPKVIIFFLAFLPQFVQPNHELFSNSQQLLLLGALFIVVTMIVFSVIAICAGWLRRYLLSKNHIDTWLQRISSVVFTLVALRLLISLFE